MVLACCVTYLACLDPVSGDIYRPSVTSHTFHALLFKIIYYTAKNHCKQ